MFGAFSKAVGYLFGADDNEEEANLQTEYTVERAQISQEDVDSDIKTDYKERNFTGKVTEVSDNHGLIDGEVYFSFNSVIGGRRPVVGETANVIARQTHSGGAWKAHQVSIRTDWSECITEGAELKDGTPIVSPVTCSDTFDERATVGVITKFKKNEQCGIINEDIRFSTCDINSDAEPLEGDWVTALVTTDDSGSSTAKKIYFNRSQHFEGEITAFQHDHGYINGDIYFPLCACLNGYRPRRWEQVKGTVIESIQGKCNWRAINVIPLPNSGQRKSDMSASVISSPTRSHFLEQLLSDKDGVTVTSPIDFGELTFLEKKVLTVWIRNNGVKPQVFQCCYFTSENSQFTVDCVKLLKMRSGKTMAHQIQSVTQNVTLYPTMCLYVNLSCSSRTNGNDKQLLIFKFENFKIGRHVQACVRDPSQSILGIYGSQDNSKMKSTGFQRYKTSMQNEANGWLVPGQKPERFKNSVKLPNRLPQYPIPYELRGCVLDHDDLLYFSPELSMALNFKNYKKRFQTLLFLEEIQMEIDIREFDINRVCLRQYGEFLALEVPGLAEGRPSVLIGDAVILSDPGDPDGPCYEGIVHEIFSREVLLKFSDNFHQQYHGEDYNVIFKFNRTQIRRSHQAAEFAINLGENVLFPSALEPKKPQFTKAQSKAEQQDVRPAMSYSRLKHSKSVKSSQVCKFYNRQLNERQQAAVFRILQGQSRPVPYILFGPPGTGKTVTFVEAILQVFTQIPGSRIIACAPSNSASDLLAERLHLTGFVKTSDMVRLNAKQRHEDNLPDCIRCYCTYGENLDLVARYRIVVCTCVSAGNFYTLGLKPGHFTHVFVDEAGQATEPECLIPAGFTAGSDAQIVLAGDPLQLGPVLRSKYSKKYGLELSFLERLTERPLYCRNESKFSDHGCYDPLLVTKLVNNYRNHHNILKLPSQRFYHDELIEKADKELTHRFCEWSLLPRKGFPVIFHGVRGEDMREGNSPSWFNPVETVQVVRYLQELFNDNSLHVSPDDIGVITPYRKQVEKIRMLIESLNVQMVKVGSVEEFQGQERQIIIISTVRSNENFVGFDLQHTLGFLSNPKRFNVSITRAQALLIIVGNPHVLCQDENWNLLLQYCTHNGVYTGCNPPNLDDDSSNRSSADHNSPSQLLLMKEARVPETS